MIARAKERYGVDVIDVKQMSSLLWAQQEVAATWWRPELDEDLSNRGILAGNFQQRSHQAA